MGGSSIKRIFLGQKKKKRSPLNKAWKDLKRALPKEKHKKKGFPSLKKKKKKNSQKRFSLTDKKETFSLKRFSLGNKRKESAQAASPEKKSNGGVLGKISVSIKKKVSQDSPKGLSVKQEADSPKPEVPKKTLSEILKSVRPVGSKANQLREKQP